MNVGASYQLKQSRIQMSVDSDLVIKSFLETQINPGLNMQLCSEMHHATESYKFGFGVNFG